MRVAAIWMVLACFGIVAAASPATAQSQDVTLRSFDGTFEAIGELLSVEGDFYEIRTEIGELTVRKEFVECLGSACPNQAVEAAPNDETVEIRSLDGGSSFTGILKGSEGDNYMLETSLGLLQIRKEFVECIGSACPVEATTSEEFTISVPAGVGQRIVSLALQQFAAEKSLNVTPSIAPEGGATQYILATSRGDVAARINAVEHNASAAMEALQKGDSAFALTRYRVDGETIAGIFGTDATAASDLLLETTIGLDAVTPVLHPGNPLQSLTIDQVVGVMQGSILDWSQIGGLEGAIRIYRSSDTVETSELFNRAFREYGRFPAVSGDNADTNAPVGTAVANDPKGFGLLFRSDLSNAAAPSLQASCGIIASPDAFTLQTEEYPITNRWSKYELRNRAATGVAASFSDFLLSESGQIAVERAGLVGLNVGRAPMFAQGERLLSAVLSGGNSGVEFRTVRDYLGTVVNAERLSTTFRFLTGSSQLDQRALQDLVRLSDLVSAPEFAGRKIILAGFSDAIGAFGLNISLSRNRAGSVRDALLAETVGVLSRDDIVIAGFGPVAPVGCNNTDEGRDLNRRVEIWIQ